MPTSNKMRRKTRTPSHSKSKRSDCRDVEKIQKSKPCCEHLEPKEKKRHQSSRIISLLKMSCPFIFCGMSISLVFFIRNNDQDTLHLSSHQDSEKDDDRHSIWQEYVVLDTIPHDPSSFT